jgi:RNA polymerase sigma-70 factor (ECF subfamily)
MRGEASARQSFQGLAEPYRRELRLHCYRMLGSVHEAEDLVQETYLRAWRSFDSFDASGSMRGWLYRIATNACLNALKSRKRSARLLPDSLGPASVTVQMPEGGPPDFAWLEPYPDSQLGQLADEAAGPERRYAAAEAVQLAFIAVIQQLPPRQRAVLLLCDVLGWTAAEAATLLGGSSASIHSALQRSRETLARRFPDGRPPVPPHADLGQQQLLGRYLRAWESHDLADFAALLKDDATFAMPPWAQWYAGREAIRTFFGLAWQHCNGVRLVPTAANGQPAFAAYSRAGERWTPQSLHVLTLEAGRIAALTLFVETDGRLFQAFGLPLTLDADVSGLGR